MFRAAVGEVVAGDGGDDDVLEFEALRGGGDAGGFVGFEGEGFRGGDGAEAAGARAAVAGDHEGGGAAAPAFPMVRALGAFADGVEVEVREEIARGDEAARSRQFQPQPIGEAGAWGRERRGHEILAKRETGKGCG